MNEIHRKISNWSELHQQWRTMESRLRASSAHPSSDEGTEISAIEVELRALRAKVDRAFNDAAAAVHNQNKAERDRPNRRPMT